MKTYRRIEITAFRRRVTIVSGNYPKDTQTDEEVCINDPGSSETVEISSAEGQRILLEAVRLLEEKIAKQAERQK